VFITYANIISSVMHFNYLKQFFPLSIVQYRNKTLKKSNPCMADTGDFCWLLRFFYVNYFICSVYCFTMYYTLKDTNHFLIK
jgi:hypothetical protein